MKTGKRTLALLLALVFALGALTACGGNTTAGDKVVESTPDNTASPQTGETTPDAGAQSEKTPDPAPAAEGLSGVHAAESYDELFESVNLGYGGWKSEEIAVDGALSSPGDMAVDDVMDDVVVSPAESETSAATDSADAVYTDTNTQVDGVDEGDIVKTDGEYLYILRDGVTLTIARADGENTAVVLSLIHI